MATQHHTCTACRRFGHNRRTCPALPVRPAEPKKLPRGRAIDPRYHEMPPEEAERLLVSLRPLVRECSGEPGAMDSLLLSVYLRGMLDADVAREAAAS